MSSVAPALGKTVAETYRSSGRVPISGLILAFVILLPAAILLGVMYSGAVVWIPFVKLRGLITLVYGSAPFCEDCNEWTEETPRLADLPVSPHDPAWKEFADGDLDAVKRLKVELNPSEFVALELAACSHCQNSDFVSAVGIQLMADSNGEVKAIETDIVRHLRISREQLNVLKEFANVMADAVEAMSEEDADDEWRTLRRTCFRNTK